MLRRIFTSRGGLTYEFWGSKLHLVDKLIIRIMRRLAVQTPADVNSLDYLSPVLPWLLTLGVAGVSPDNRAIASAKRLRELDMITKDEYLIDARQLLQLERFSCEWNERLIGLIRLRSLKHLTIFHASVPCLEQIEADLDHLSILASRKVQHLPALSNCRNIQSLRVAGPVQFDAHSLGHYQKIDYLWFQGIQRISGLVEASQQCQFDQIYIEGLRRVDDPEALLNLRAKTVKLQGPRNLIPDSTLKLLQSSDVRWEVFLG